CIVLEIPTRPEAAGMHHALGNTLMVEVEELLAEVKIFERRGAARPNPERILVVGNGGALLRGQDGRVTAGALVHFTASTGRDVLISVLCRFALAVSTVCCATRGGFLCHGFLLSHISHPSRLSVWRKCPDTVHTSLRGAQSVPGQRGGCPLP